MRKYNIIADLVTSLVPHTKIHTFNILIPVLIRH